MRIYIYIEILTLDISYFSIFTALSSVFSPRRYASSSVSKCRSDCRSLAQNDRLTCASGESATCAHYAFKANICAFYDLRADGQSVTVEAKVTNCLGLKG